MSPRRVVFVLGCAVLVGSAAGVAIVACGDSTGSPAATPSSASAASESPVSTVPPPAATPTATPPPDIPAARELYREGRYEEASAAFIAAAPANGELRAEALIGAAVADLSAGTPAAAVAPLAEAMSAAPPASNVHARASYLLARTLNDLGRPAETLQALNSPPAALAQGALAPYVEAEIARALSLSGDTAGAAVARAKLLARPNLPNEIAADLYREAAAEAKAAGDYNGYVTNLAAAVAADPTAVDRLALAEALAEAQDPGALKHLADVVQQTPSSRLALLALDRLKALGGSVDPGLEGQVRYRQGDYPGARAVLEEAVTAGTASNPASAAFYLAAVYEETDTAAKTIAAYDAVSGDLAWVHRARYWAAYVMAGSGDLRSASARYASLAASGPPGEFSGEAAYEAGALLLRAGDASGAVAAWDAAAAGDPRTLYWKGRALEALGRPAEATDSFLRASTAGPYEFHGLEARRRLDAAGPLDVSYRERDLERPADFDAISAWLATKVAGAEPGLEFSLARDFVAIGERDRAASIVRAAGEGEDPWTVLAALREAASLQLTDVTASLATRLRVLAGSTYDDTEPALLRLAYPLSYVGLLDAESRQAEIDPLFLAALVRIESLWNPGAVSIADARGLTQVIPPTGQAIADSLGVEDFAIEHLFRPAVSLRFGADYISGQLRRFGRPDAALAAYNGGPGNAERWLLEAPGDSMADYAATVDFSETQSYVEFVLEAYAVYQLAWSSTR